MDFSHHIAIPPSVGFGNSYGGGNSSKVQLRVHLLRMDTLKSGDSRLEMAKVCVSRKLPLSSH